MSASRLIRKIPAEGMAPDANPQTTEAHSRPIHTLDGTVVIVLAKLRPRHWYWGWNRIAFGRWLSSNLPGLKFIKTLGSGLNGGFGLVPSPSHQGMFCVFDSAESAQAFIDEAPLMHRYRSVSDELFTAVLRPYSVRGSWDGVSLAPSAPVSGMIATLTRASIRPLAAASFWRHAPAAQRSLLDAPGCALAIGLGEAPLLRQATFSLWDDATAMDAYARTGAHLDAIRAAWKHQFFSESMFVRFAPLQLQGQWKGRRFA